MLVRIASMMAAALLLVACTEAGPFSDIPQPYRPSGKGSFDATRLVMADHIVVSEIEGLEASVANPLRKEIASALAKNDVLATVEAPPMRTSTLKGTFIETEDPRILWTLLDPYGMTSGRFETSLPLAALIYPETAEEARKNAAYLVAARLSGRPQAERPNLAATLPLSGPQPAGKPRAAAPQIYGDLPPLFFLPILGAPGDGNSSLDAAMRSALKRRGIEVLTSPDPDDLQLQCFVSVRPQEGGLSVIQLFWEVKTPDGKSIASVDQANTLETGALDGPWGSLATDIAEAAADGIAQFLGQSEP